MTIIIAINAAPSKTRRKLFVKTLIVREDITSPLVWNGFFIRNMDSL